MSDEELIAELLVTWEEQQERGHELPTEELCRGNPHLSDRVAEALNELNAANWLRQHASGRGEGIATHWVDDVLAGRRRIKPMEEPEWLACTDQTRMLAFLRGQSPSPR